MLTNLPNLLTLSRIGVIPLLIATFYIESDLGNWLGLGVLVYAGITDFIDGLVARLMSQQSELGRFLDPIADKVPKHWPPATQFPQRLRLPYPGEVSTRHRAS